MCASDIGALFDRTYLPGTSERFVLVDYEESGAKGRLELTGRKADPPSAGMIR